MSKLPPASSPVAQAYLHPATAQLWRELLANRTLSVGDLAGMASLPVNTLRDAMNGKCPLAISFHKPTASERDGEPCWELYCVLI